MPRATAIKFLKGTVSFLVYCVILGSTGMTISQAAMLLALPYACVLILISIESYLSIFMAKIQEIETTEEKD